MRRKDPKDTRDTRRKGSQQARLFPWPLCPFALILNQAYQRPSTTGSLGFSIPRRHAKLRLVPELPDITVYLEALERRVLGERLERLRLASPFVLRTAMPPLTSVHGANVIALRRIGKRIAFGFEADLWLVVHLMIAGGLHWRPA